MLLPSNVDTFLGLPISVKMSQTGESKRPVGDTDILLWWIPGGGGAGGNDSGEQSWIQI